MFSITYFIIVLALGLQINAWAVIDGPSSKSNLPENPYLASYEEAMIREKVRAALDQLEKNSKFGPGQFNQQDEIHHDNNRRSAITKNQLNRIVKAMRTRMFGSI